jgi:hypothetical protein
MKWLIVPEDKLAELQAINEVHEDRKCEPMQTTTGVWVTGADKLGDSYWVDWHDFLSSLTEFEGVPEFPRPEEEL